MKIFSFRIFIQLTLVLFVGLLVGCASNDEALVKPTPKPRPMSIEDNYSIKLHVYPTPISVGEGFSSREMDSDLTKVQSMN